MKWEKVKLGELFQIKHGWAFKGEYFSNEGELIIVTPGNFNEAGGFRQVAGKEKYYLGEFPNDFLLKKNDLVIAMTEQGEGLLGSPALIPSDGKYLHNQRIGLIQNVDVRRAALRYLYYLFFTPTVRAPIFGSATGTKVKHTAPRRIYDIQVQLPAVNIQHKIATILSAYDDLIENNLKRIKLLEEQAFLRYKGIVRSEKSTNVKLKEVAVVNDESLKSNTNLEKILYVDIASVSTGNIESKTEYDYKQAPGRAKRIVKHQDIVWSCVRPNRRSYSLVWNPEENLIASTGFAVITAREIPATFLYQLVTSNEFVSYLVNHAKGATYPAVTASDF